MDGHALCYLFTFINAPIWNTHLISTWFMYSYYLYNVFMCIYKMRWEREVKVSQYSYYKLHRTKTYMLIIPLTRRMSRLKQFHFWNNKFKRIITYLIFVFYIYFIRQGVPNLVPITNEGKEVEGKQRRQAFPNRI